MILKCVDNTTVEEMLTVGDEYEGSYYHDPGERKWVVIERTDNDFTNLTFRAGRFEVVEEDLDAVDEATVSCTEVCADAPRVIWESKDGARIVVNPDGSDKPYLLEVISGHDALGNARWWTYTEPTDDLVGTLATGIVALTGEGSGAGGGL
jgi:hypothetical protein